MKITLISIGTVKKKSVKDGVEDYLKRIKRHMAASIVEIKTPPFSPKAPPEEGMRREAELAMKALGKGDFLIALSERGREFTTEEFSLLLADFMGGRGRFSGKKGLAFLIGGAYGLHKSIIERADMVLSLSRMTFPHEMALLLTAEQIYRAFTIIKGEPYSH